MTVDRINALERWYSKRLNGDWEHGNPFYLTAIDNPGWSISISVDEGQDAADSLADVHVKHLEYDRGAEWLYIDIDGSSIRVSCGPRDLGRALDVALLLASGATSYSKI